MFKTSWKEYRCRIWSGPSGLIASASGISLFGFEMEPKVTNSSHDETAHEEIARKNILAKREVAKKASELIKRRASIFLGPGTP